MLELPRNSLKRHAVPYDRFCPTSNASSVQMARGGECVNSGIINLIFPSQRGNEYIGETVHYAFASRSTYNERQSLLHPRKGCREKSTLRHSQSMLIFVKRTNASITAYQYWLKSDTALLFPSSPLLECNDH